MYAGKPRRRRQYRLGAGATTAWAPATSFPRWSSTTTKQTGERGGEKLRERPRVDVGVNVSVTLALLDPGNQCGALAILHDADRPSDLRVMPGQVHGSVAHETAPGDCRARSNRR